MFDGINSQDIYLRTWLRVTQFSRVSELTNVSPLQVSGFASRTALGIIISLRLATPRFWYKVKTASVITSKKETILPCRVGSLTITEMSDMVSEPI